ncbi:hypothetical protein J6590_031675 [Homalodisca vitripennis]|nr:hypothetical protein J6590_031675 [Homalodisca vitripennis]
MIWGLSTRQFYRCPRLTDRRMMCSVIATYQLIWTLGPADIVTTAGNCQQVSFIVAPGATAFSASFNYTECIADSKYRSICKSILPEEKVWKNLPNTFPGTPPPCPCPHGSSESATLVKMKRCVWVDYPE